MQTKVEEMKRDRSFLNLDKVFNTFYSPVMGFENLDDYCKKSTAAVHIKNINKPALFLQSEDDPAVMFNFDKEAFKNNPNVALASLKSGGHTATYENVLSADIWMIKPVLAYFNTFAE